MWKKSSFFQLNRLNALCAFGCLCLLLINWKQFYTSAMPWKCGTNGDLVKEFTEKLRRNASTSSRRSSFSSSRNAGVNSGQSSYDIENYLRKRNEGGPKNDERDDRPKSGSSRKNLPPSHPHRPPNNEERRKSGNRQNSAGKRVEEPNRHHSSNRNRQKSGDRHHRPKSRDRDRHHRPKSEERRRSEHHRHEDGPTRKSGGRNRGRSKSAERKERRPGSSSKRRSHSRGRNEADYKGKGTHKSGGRHHEGEKDGGSSRKAALPKYDPNHCCGYIKDNGKKEAVLLKYMVRFYGENGEVYLRDEHQFARGGQGKLYYAYSFKHEKCVALKIVDLKNLHGGKYDSAMNEFKIVNYLKRKNESRANKFQKIIEIYENFEEKEYIYTMMELGKYDLETYLQQEIQTEGDTAKRFKLIGQLTFLMINALTELHSAGVMHLDFKLKNAILIKSEKNNKLAVKLIDFGASRRTQSDKNLEEISESINLENKIFTKMYVAPEVIRSNEVSIRSDIWSLGTVLADMLADERDFDSNYRLYFRKSSRDGRHHPIDSWPREFDSFTDYVRRERMPRFNNDVKRMLNEHNKHLWLIAFACLRIHIKDRPYAFQLVAYMRDWCILEASRAYDCVPSRTFSGKKTKDMLYCDEMEDKQFVELKNQSKGESSNSGQ